MNPLRFRLRSLILFIIPAVGVGAWFAGPPPICKVHGVLMTRESLTIHYGLLYFDDYENGYSAAKLGSFPNCDDCTAGRCVVGPEKARLTDVCSRCNAARDAWRQTHPGRTPNKPVRPPRILVSPTSFLVQRSETRRPA